MKRLVIAITVIAIVLSTGVNGVRRTNGRKRAKTAGNEKKKNDSESNKKYQIPSWSNTDAILEAVDPTDYHIPKTCSEDELTTTLKRCVLIWKKYCECEHCTAGCSKREWPPVETDKWNSKREDIGWENLDEAWRWTGKCASLATNLWRSWCRDGKITNKETGIKEEHKYWFLLNLDDKTNVSMVQELCWSKECPNVSIEVQETTTTMLTTSPPGATTTMLTTSPPGEKEMNLQRIIECNEDELNTMMKHCMLIWKEYCRCAGCREAPLCEKKEWPPQQTKEWGSKKNGLEDIDNAWKWVGQCAYNATDVWRYWCYVRSPDSDEFLNQKEPEYWFLTELEANTHPKMIQGLCETSECSKFKEILKPALAALDNTTKAAFQPSSSAKEHPTTPTKGTTINNNSSTKTQPSRVSVPKWAYIIIVVLGSIVIVMVALLVLCLYYRGQNKKRNIRQLQSERRGTTSTVNTTPWQHQTSFTFFGEQALPGMEESIYHTIRDARPPPVSPTFALASFSPNANVPNTTASKSISNVLYHDTKPRYVNAFPSREPSQNNAHTHTYEETGPISQSEIPDMLPYFIPTSVTARNEYGTLGEPSEEPEEQHTRNHHQDNKGNYDHIELL